MPDFKLEYTIKGPRKKLNQIIENIAKEHPNRKLCGGSIDLLASSEPMNLPHAVDKLTGNQVRVSDYKIPKGYCCIEIIRKNNVTHELSFYTRNTN